MNSKTDPIYNQIGKTYDVTRRADPSIVETLIHSLSPVEEGKYLDLACGSGNYTIALHDSGLNISGLDISPTMLKSAKSKNPKVSWHLGNAISLPFEDNSFQGTTCILATHHISDLSAAFDEVYRVMNQGKFVLFTCTPEQMQQYWLNHYFPQMMEQSRQKLRSLDDLTVMLNTAGFQNVQQTPFYVTNQLQDLFLYSGKYRPEIYLDTKIRQGISSFQLAPSEEEVINGLKNLQADIRSGAMQEMIQKHESSLGEYLFVVAVKK